MLEFGLVALITADGPIAALIGNRVYPVIPPDDDSSIYPCLSYQVITSSPSYTLEGKQVGSKRIQFDAWGNTYDDCRAVLIALRNLLDTYQGTLSDGTKLLCAYRGIEMDQFESFSRVYRCLCEYSAEFIEP